MKIAEVNLLDVGLQIGTNGWMNELGYDIAFSLLSFCILIRLKVWR